MYNDSYGGGHKPTRKKCKYCNVENGIDEKRCFACGSTQFEIIPYQPHPVVNTPPPAPQPSATNAQHSSSSAYVKSFFLRHLKLVITIISILFFISIFVPVLASFIDSDDGWEWPDDEIIDVYSTTGQTVPTVWFDFRVTKFARADSFKITYQTGVAGNTGGRTGTETIYAGAGFKLYVVYLTLSAPNVDTDMNNLRDFSLETDTYFTDAAGSDIDGLYFLSKGQSDFETVVVFRLRSADYNPYFTYSEPEGAEKGKRYLVPLIGEGIYLPQD